LAQAGEIAILILSLPFLYRRDGAKARMYPHVAPAVWVCPPHWACQGFWSDFMLFLARDEKGSLEGKQNFKTL
jgi:hypothetical protein